MCHICLMTLGLLVIFIFYEWNINHKLNHIFEDFFRNFLLVNGWIQTMSVFGS